MRCELWSISSAVTGRNVCAMRMAHNKKVSPAAHATTILHLFMQCEAIDIGRNSELGPRPEVIPVMISAARRSSSRLRLECRGAWRYWRRRAGRLRDRRDTSLQRGGQSAMASNRGQGAWKTPVRSVEHLTEWRGDGPSGPPQAFVLELWVGRAERGQRRAEGPLSGWIRDRTRFLYRTRQLLLSIIARTESSSIRSLGALDNGKVGLKYRRA